MGAALQLGHVHMIATGTMLWPALLEPDVAMLQSALPNLDLLGPPFTHYAFGVFSRSEEVV